MDKRRKPHQGTVVFPKFSAEKMKSILSQTAKPGMFGPHLRTMKPGQMQVPKMREDYGCELCIAFWNEALDNLIQIIENIGVGAGCSAICGALPQQWEQQICLLLCEIVGSEYFGELVNDIDPDPIWNCMELYACPSVSNVTGNITSITVTPKVGPVGNTFSVTATYKVSATGTGQVVLYFVAPDDGFEFGFFQNIISLPAGSYTTTESFSSAPTEEAPFYDGTYTVFAEVCEGTCGGTHSYEYNVAIDATLFNMVN